MLNAAGSVRLLPFRESSRGERSDAILIYRQTGPNGFRQTAMLNRVVVDRNSGECIMPHENTLSRKVDTLHGEIMQSMVALTSIDPVFLLGRINRELRQHITWHCLIRKPMLRRVDAYHIIHEVFEIPAFLGEKLLDDSQLVIADGHHRVAVASRLAEAQGSVTLPAMIIHCEDAEVASYNRVIQTGSDPSAILERIGRAFVREPFSPVMPSNSFAVYGNGTWAQYRIPHDETDLTEVERVQELIVAAIFGIHRPETDTRILFVEGRLGTSEVEKVSRTLTNAIGIATAAPCVRKIFNAAKSRRLFPPHSTWFAMKPLPGITRQIACRESVHVRTRYSLKASIV